MVERGPEKAGVGGSIPSLATTLSTTYNRVERQFRSETFQSRGGVGLLRIRNTFQTERPRPNIGSTDCGSIFSAS